MDINKTEDLLRKFDYKIQRKQNIIEIELDCSLALEADFSNPDKLYIRNKFLRYNFSSTLKSSAHAQILFQPILILIYALLETMVADYILYLFIGSCYIYLLIVINHFIKAYSLQKLLILWNSK